MILIFLLLVLSFVAIYTVGFGANKLIANISKKYTNNFPCIPLTIDETFFFGFVFISAFISTYSIFFPVNGYAVFLLSIVVFGLIYLYKNEISASLKTGWHSFKNLSVYLRSSIILFVLIVILIDSIGILNYDSALYHTASIKWIQDYSVVPGLANLHSRFGFNSMYFPISALFNLNTTFSTIYPLSSLLLLMVFARIFFNYKNKKTSAQKSILYLIVFCLLLMSKNITYSLSSPSTDFPVAILGIYALILFMEKNKDISKNLNLFILFVAVVLTCSVFKLSAVILTVSFLFIVGNCFKSIKTRIFLILCIAILIIFPFLIRNYYLTGYLIYPFSLIDVFNPDWKLPISSVDGESNWIKSWAKLPGQPQQMVLQLPISKWLPIWFSIKPLGSQIALFTMLLPFFVIPISAIKKDILSLKIAIIIIAYLSFWFITAPDPRFAIGIISFASAFGASFLINLFISFAQNNAKATELFGKISRRAPIIFVSACMGVLIVSNWGIINYGVRLSNITHPATYGTNINGYSNTPLLNSDFKYKTPLKGDQCYLLAMCTPHKNNNIGLRKKNDIQSGFKIFISPNK